MLKNYLFSTFRNLIKQKAFALINILGLAIGLCVFMVIALYVDKELSYDKKWQNSDRILRLNMVLNPDSLNPVTFEPTSFLIMPPLQQYFTDQLELSARRVIRGRSVIIGEDSYPGGLWLYERDFIDIFKFDVIAGSLESTMENPNRIGLSESTAEKYFGTVDVLDRTVSLEVPDVGLVDFLVTAVYRVPKGESSLDFPTIALFDETAMTERVESLNSWGPGGWIVVNYFLLKSGADLSLMNAQMDDFMAQHAGPTPNADYFILRFQKLLDIHFNPTRSDEQGGDKTQLTIFAVIAILVLLVGSINFVILSTANSIDRRQEVGVRKVSGATKNQVIFQFLGESLLLTSIAFIVALMLLELSLPFFARLIGQALTVEYLTFSNLIFTLTLITVVGGLGGLYPALVLAKLKPAGMLRGNDRGNIIGSINVRNALVGFQFSIAIFLLITTLVLYAQLSFYQNRDHGFNAENLITLHVPDAAPDRVRLTSLLMAEIEKLPGVESIALSYSQPNDSANILPLIPITSVSLRDNTVESMGLFVDYNFFAVYEIPLLAGRVYDVSLDSPVDRGVREIVINRFAANALGFKSPDAAIGQFLDYGKIIGVVENSEFLSFRRDISAEIYPLILDYSFVITVRYNESYLSTITADIESVWQDIIGDVPLNINFVTQLLQEVFTQEENEGKLLIVLSLLSILVSCMGLYGLVAFAIKRQVKEVGIRKVLGAEFLTILKLFIWQFTRPVLLANVIAWPLALWAMANWLQRFPNQIDTILLLPLCMMAGFIALFIATVTVVGTVSKSANAKPVLALRYE